MFVAEGLSPEPEILALVSWHIPFSASRRAKHHCNHRWSKPLIPVQPPDCPRPILDTMSWRRGSLTSLPLQATNWRTPPPQTRLHAIQAGTDEAGVTDRFQGRSVDLGLLRLLVSVPSLTGLLDPAPETTNPPLSTSSIACLTLHASPPLWMSASLSPSPSY